MAEWSDDPVPRQVVREGQPRTIVCFYFLPKDGPVIALAPRMAAYLRAHVERRAGCDCGHCTEAKAIVRELDEARKGASDATSPQA